MKTMTSSQSRGHYDATLDAVTQDREEAVITRAGKAPVVLVTLDDYEPLQKTAYLLRSPANARRLLGSIDRLKIGAGAQHSLVDDHPNEPVESKNQ